MTDKHPDETWQAYAHRLATALIEARDHLWSDDVESAEAVLTDAIEPSDEPWASLRAKPGYVAGSCVFVTPAGNFLTVAGSWDQAMWEAIVKMLPRSTAANAYEAQVFDRVRGLS